MNYNINEKKIELIHDHFKKELKIGSDLENVYRSKQEIKRLKREKTRLKMIIRFSHPSDRDQYKELLNQLNTK